jgi:uncharacterized protein YigE (DUF2233 family)
MHIRPPFPALLAPILGLLLLTLPAASTASDSAAWERIADDLEISRKTLWPGSVLSPELLFIRTTLRRYRLGVVRAADYRRESADASTLCMQSKAVLCMNANFFDENGRALGLVISRGNMYQKIHSGGKTLTGILQVAREGVRILNRSDFKPEAVIEAVQAGPRLVASGEAVRGLGPKDSHSRRAGVCLDHKGRFVFYISSGLIGITILQVQEILLDPRIGCAEALNLDGGSSAQLFVSKKLPEAAEDAEEISVQGSSNVPVVLGLFQKD